MGWHSMGWLRLVGSLKLQVPFAEYRLFYRALLQKRPMILRSLLIIATPYVNHLYEDHILCGSEKWHLCDPMWITQVARRKWHLCDPLMWSSMWSTFYVDHISWSYTCHLCVLHNTMYMWSSMWSTFYVHHIICGSHEWIASVARRNLHLCDPLMWCSMGITWYMDHTSGLHTCHWVYCYSMWGVIFYVDHTIRGYDKYLLCVLHYTIYMWSVTFYVHHNSDTMHHVTRIHVSFHSHTSTHTNVYANNHYDTPVEHVSHT